MNLSIAMVISWVVALLLLGALGAYAVRERTRARALEHELRMRTEAWEQSRLEFEEEARQAVARAEASVRAELESGARTATGAAVRSFGTSVVSLGADVGQVVSNALREHRGDEVYETLTRIDHSVQQMLRQAQSYVIVSGGLPGRRWPQQPLTDIVGGAIGRVRDFTRVRFNQLDRVVISRAVEPLVHTIATLLDNALRYSPPTSYVDVGFQEGHHGVTIIIDDAGVRMNNEQMEEARQVLAGERSVDIHQLGPTPRVGFPSVSALARRYGFTVYVDGPNAYGGTRAMVFVPEALFVPRRAGVDGPATEVVPVPQVDAPAPDPAPAPAPTEEPASVRDITEGGLPKRRRRSPALAAVGTAREPRPEAETQQDTSTIARPDIAAAWHSGSQSGRAAAR
ncbi:ATP-binding protein [Nocardia otitidiscaviarum]|nr:ATP-binding protein [Nocardia otitidiscaviarum]MCP9620209.1 sensor histidine kinase [Nocardia otitidiscaviarum]